MADLLNAQPNAEDIIDTGVPEGAVGEPQEELSPARQAFAKLTGELSEEGAPAPRKDASRDPVTGKFAKAEGAPASAVTEPKPSDIDPSLDNQAKAPAAVSEAAGGPPAGWDADAKKLWPSLPPAIQAAVSRREQDVNDGFRQKSEELRMWSGINEDLQPFRQTFANWGAQNDREAVQHLLSFAKAYDDSPVLLLQHLAHHANIDLKQLAENPTQPQAPRAPQADPAILGKLSELEQRFEEITTGNINGTLKTFASNPEHAHYEDVRKDMANLIEKGVVEGDTPEEVLKAAYDRAVWMNPTVREKVLAERDQGAQRTRQDAAKAKAQSARRASVSLPRGTPNGLTPSSAEAEGSSPARKAFAMLAGRV